MEVIYIFRIVLGEGKFIVKGFLEIICNYWVRCGVSDVVFVVFC